MKEDVLEQVVDDYLQLRGYFTTHNLRFKPDKSHPKFVSAQDSVPSDVDVIGINPLLTGPARVRVVSCKAWQTGFNADAKLREMRGQKKNAKRETPCVNSVSCGSPSGPRRSSTPFARPGANRCSSTRSQSRS